MPYIPQSERGAYDGDINNLIESWVRNGCREGHLNYIITRLCKGALKPKNYAKINAVMGVLSCVGYELYRRDAAAYEDGKEVENGSVQ